MATGNGRRAHTDGDGQDGFAGYRDLQVFDGNAYAFGEVQGAIEVRRGERDDKLFAPVAPNEVGLSNGRGHH
ncbi:MAG: hypothetical protein U5Q44_03245 [Dehalococcoidia bacterium]|nr:hypothetical protein [Dehalococcoidia bacterium]